MQRLPTEVFRSVVRSRYTSDDYYIHFWIFFLILVPEPERRKINLGWKNHHYWKNYTIVSSLLRPEDMSNETERGKNNFTDSAKKNILGCLLSRFQILAGIRCPLFVVGQSMYRFIPKLGITIIIHSHLIRRDP